MILYTFSYTFVFPDTWYLSIYIMTKTFMSEATWCLYTSYKNQYQLGPSSESELSPYSFWFHFSLLLYQHCQEEPHMVQKPRHSLSPSCCQIISSKTVSAPFSYQLCVCVWEHNLLGRILRIKCVDYQLLCYSVIGFILRYTGAMVGLWSWQTQQFIKIPSCTLAGIVTMTGISTNMYYFNSNFTYHTPWTIYELKTC